MAAVRATVTYRRRRGGNGEDVITTLGRAGLTTASAEPFRCTVLDTFDGRVHGAGLRLDIGTSTPDARRAASMLVLRGTSGADATVAVLATPLIATDVPAGPLRARLAGLLDVRVLLVRLVVDSMLSEARHTNDTGKVTVRARVHQDVRAGSSLAEIEPSSSELVEVVELAGYPKPAADVREALERAGWVSEPGDAVDLAASAVPVDLGDRSVTPGITLDATTPAPEAFRTVLANLRDAMVVNWDATVTDIDPEFLHDLRVAVRRTRSVLSSGKGVMTDAVRDHARAEFGWLGAVTGPPRDLDVATIEWPSVVGDLDPEAVAALDVTRAHLARDQDAAHRQLSAELTSERARALMAWWSTWLDEPANHEAAGAQPAGATPERADEVPIGALIAKRIRAAHRTLIAEGRQITPETPAAVVHELRKDAKKLRYLIECFGGLYGASARKPFVQVLKSLQDSLGAHQDADVHIERLRALAASTAAATWPTESVVAIGQLIERQDRLRQSTRQDIVARFAAFDDETTRESLARVLASRATS